MAEIIDFKTKKPIARFNELSQKEQHMVFGMIGLLLKEEYGFEYLRSLLNECDRELLDKKIMERLSKQNLS